MRWVPFRAPQLPTAWPRRLGWIFRQRRPAAYIVGWFLEAVQELSGAAAPSPFNDGAAGVSCPVAVLCVAVEFHVDIKILSRG
jgi:hypothetical protein